MLRIAVLAVVAALVVWIGQAAEKEIVLATDGATEYSVIVRANQPRGEKFVVDDFRALMKQATGAEFQVVDAAKAVLKEGVPCKVAASLWMGGDRFKPVEPAWTSEDGAFGEGGFTPTTSGFASVTATLGELAAFRVHGGKACPPPRFHSRRVPVQRPVEIVKFFIPAAEKSGAIHRIGAFVLEEVCKFIGSPEYTVSLSG